jgi:hypothetical protein
MKKERNIGVSDQVGDVLDPQREEDLPVVCHESGRVVQHTALLRELLQILAPLDSAVCTRDRDLEELWIHSGECEACERLASAQFYTENDRVAVLDADITNDSR